MFLLDTDHLVVLQRRSQPAYAFLHDRQTKHSPSAFFVSIISFHEQALGWNAFINRASKTEETVFGYEMLRLMLESFAKAQVLPFDAKAASVFMSLRKDKIRIGTMDLRIAAIALSRDLTVLTRNIGDFRKVSGLKAEDWTTE